MRMIVEAPAARWYKREMSLSDGDSLRIFVRMGGCGSVVPGLSLGVMQDKPVNPALSEVVEGIRFYIEDDNMWYLGHKELHIVYDEKNDDIALEVV
ncbi:hypothetical protein [Paenibacillus terrigena]|uniref:HesB/YadR/YfhF family protein n=1 Tax=Paenibacillus terrigena TaxID=369333 RepID=UPI0028D8C609|nr:hypothetical protein [Paenibacillus terrigena]